jgi:hypothetical protein
VEREHGERKKEDGRDEPENESRAERTTSGPAVGELVPGSSAAVKERAGVRARSRRTSVDDLDLERGRVGRARG